MNKANLTVWQRKAKESDAKAAEWQAKIDNASAETTSHQLGIWRSRVKEHKRRARANRERIEYYSN
jgi:hypothetical protein